MGTTVTTNHALIKPDINESIKEDLPTFAGWAAQNAINCDKIDALFRATTHTWTPTLTGTGSNPTLGAGGFVEGKYLRLYPRMVFGYVRIYFGGAGFAAGSGAYHSSTPPLAVVPGELIGFQNEVAIGKGFYRDDSAVATSTALTTMFSTLSSTFFFKLPINDSWGAASPVAVAQQDRLSGWFMYPTTSV